MFFRGGGYKNFRKIEMKSHFSNKMYFYLKDTVCGLMHSLYFKLQHIMACIYIMSGLNSILSDIVNGYIYILGRAMALNVSHIAHLGAKFFSGLNLNLIQSEMVPNLEFIRTKNV